jgi:dihydropyrimidinase
MMTINRGRVAWKGGDLRAEKGDGKYIERPPFPAVHVANAAYKELTAPRAVERAEVTP